MKVFCLLSPHTVEIQERPMPEVRSGEALVKVLCVSICGTDIHAYNGEQAIFSYPRVIGHEICGVVEKISGADSRLKIGDKVAVIPYAHCGACIACRKNMPYCCQSLRVMGVHVDGGIAEYVAVPEQYLVAVHKKIRAKEACLVEPFSISAHAVHTAQVQQGENVLIVGAGPIGMGAAEIAKTYGAHVFLADTNSDRARFATEVMGYDTVLNPLDENYKEQLARFTNGDMPDTIIDATGNSKSMGSNFSYLSAGGKVVYLGICTGNVEINDVEFHKRQARLYGSRAATRFDFEYVIKCFEHGKIHPKLFITDEIKFDENIPVSFKKLIDKKGALFKGVITVSEE